ncbi:MAG: zeta toxin family protein [Candidatus Scatovivens sp.]
MDNDKNILNNQILNLLKKGKLDGEIKILQEKDIPLLVQIASNLDLSNNTNNEQEMVFVAAPTGAGKDTLVRKITSQAPDKKYVIFNMDMFRHYYSSIDSSKKLSDKNFAEETNDISYEIYYLLEELILNYYNSTNVILTGTIKDTSWVESILRKYKKHNYKTSLSVLAVPYSESAISIFERYLNMVKTEQESKCPDNSPIRFTSLMYHDKTFNAFNNSLKYFEDSLKSSPNDLLNSISVYKRDKSISDLSEDTLIYSSIKTPNLYATDIVNSVLNSKNIINYSRFSQLLNLVEQYSDYLKKQDVYSQILESLKKIYSLNSKDSKVSKEDKNFDCPPFD